MSVLFNIYGSTMLTYFQLKSESYVPAELTYIERYTIICLFMKDPMSKQVQIFFSLLQPTSANPTIPIK